METVEKQYRCILFIVHVTKLFITDCSDSFIAASIGKIHLSIVVIHFNDINKKLTSLLENRKYILNNFLDKNISN